MTRIIASHHFRPNKFYNLFVRETKQSKIEKFWNDNKKWTEKLIKGSACVMGKIADKLGLFYCNEYFKLDGIFYENLETKNPFNSKDIKEYGYARNVKIILEAENNPRTLFTEIYKLIPIYAAPLVVLLTYFESKGNVKDKEETEKIINAIENRISSDNFGLYKKKIKTLLILGFRIKNKIIWRGFVYHGKKFKKI